MRNKVKTKYSKTIIWKMRVKDIPIWMQSSNEYKGEVRKPSSVISAQK